MSSDNQAAAVNERDVSWFEEALARPLPCERCGNDLRDEGSVDVVMPCGVCEATCCARCGRIWAGMGPVGVGHDDHGFRGHQTIDEQPKIPVAAKRSA